VCERERERENADRIKLILLVSVVAYLVSMYSAVCSDAVLWGGGDTRTWFGVLYNLLCYLLS
jgi:hypothetical protein